MARADAVEGRRVGIGDRRRIVALPEHRTSIVGSSIVRRTCSTHRRHRIAGQDAEVHHRARRRRQDVLLHAALNDRRRGRGADRGVGLRHLAISRSTSGANSHRLANTSRWRERHLRTEKVEALADRRVDVGRHLVALELRRSRRSACRSACARRRHRRMAAAAVGRELDADVALLADATATPPAPRSPGTSPSMIEPPSSSTKSGVDAALAQRADMAAAPRRAADFLVVAEGEIDRAAGWKPAASRCSTASRMASALPLSSSAPRPQTYAVARWRRRTAAASSSPRCPPRPARRRGGRAARSACLSPRPAHVYSRL